MLSYRRHFLSPGHEWVVFVHGAGGSSSIWYRQVREFRKAFNVLLIDLRGHGDSQPPLLMPYEGEYTFDVLSREILEVQSRRNCSAVGAIVRTRLSRSIGLVSSMRQKKCPVSGSP